jgi:hypothetical protein
MAAALWQAEFRQYRPLIERIIAQTERRVLHGEAVGANEKIVSLFVTLRRGSRIQSECSRPSAMIVFIASVRDRPRWRQNHSPVCRCH